MKETAMNTNHRHTPLMTAAMTAAMTTFSMLAMLPAHAVTISASAFAAAIEPTPIDVNQNLQNGNFLILANPAAGPGHFTGDGIDETTLWRFNFNSDPNYAAFLADANIVSARLTLRLNTKFFVNGAGPVTDITFPGDGVGGVFPGWVMPQFITGTFGTFTSGSISADLIGDVGMSPSQLLGWITTYAGQFPMVYGDDAVVTFAKLDLVSAPVPEPAAWLLMVAGLMPLLARWRAGERRATRLAEPK
jgi:hypothetical protein